MKILIVEDDSQLAATLKYLVEDNPRYRVIGTAEDADEAIAAADTLLELIQRDRDWNEGAARQRLLQLIEAQGLEDPWARSQRRRLSALLFT